MGVTVGASRPGPRSPQKSFEDQVTPGGPLPTPRHGARPPNAATFSSSVIPGGGPPQAISPEHHSLTGTLPGPVGQCFRVTAGPVAPRDRPMSVEQTVSGEGRMACGAVRCAGPRPAGAALAAGVRTKRCSETTSARINHTTVGGSPDATARAGERPRLEVQRFLICSHPDASSGTPGALSAGEPGRRLRHADAPCGRLGDTSTEPASRSTPVGRCTPPQPDPRSVCHSWKGDRTTARGRTGAVIEGQWRSLRLRRRGARRLTTGLHSGRGSPR
jgi:hypothetical protein